MDPEELELQNDYRYRSYAAVIEKALRNFESSSEWADLISSLGKLNKALQSNLRYSLLPKRLIIGKRLAQCLHPALPSGVHLKALETYEVIFKIIGTKWLAKDLFIYSSGLFPLLGHAAMAVKPVLLTLYERYYLPLQRALLPSLQAFITGLLPGLEEGLEVYDRTDALLVKLSLLVGQQVFYGALWGSMLVSPLVRLPASVFIVTHFDRIVSLHQQTHMLGYDHRLVVKSVCLSLQDSNVLVQRNMLEILLYFFPFATCLVDLITVVSAASLTILRRDMSLNRRLYAWLLGTDIKGEMVAPHPTHSATTEEHTLFYFNTYSRDFLVQVNPFDTENVIGYLRPFRIIISLLDKPEIGPPVLSSVLLEVVRAFYTYCREMLGEETITSSGLSGNQLASKIKENKNASEIIKTMNMLVSSMNSEYLWDYMTRRFCTSLRYGGDNHSAPSVPEMSNLIIFLLDVIPLELHADIQSQLLPEMLGTMLRTLRNNLDSVGLEDVTHSLRACFKVLSKIQMPVAFMDTEAGAHTEEMELQKQEDTGSKTETVLTSIGGREIKEKLTELFTPSKLKTHPTPETQLLVATTEKKKESGHLGCVEWAAGYMPRGRAEISEACRQAFTATCHLLLECTTFPIYLSEEEALALHADIEVDSLPLWLRSLMTLCCLSRDYNIQHTAVASLLELINHSQSLALVIQDKQRRYQKSDYNPLSGRLQMVTVPPIYPALLQTIEESTDFYQRVSQVLWSQLDMERREQHISCVELFYRLHCLAPSVSICEDIICQALLHKDKAVRLEALHRFTVLWHLTREIQTSRIMSLNRSFDRSLCVVVDSLSCTDGLISAAAQCWLVRALSLNDVIRILEPILLLLLYPSTQCCSIQSIKQNLTAGKSRSSTKTSGISAGAVAKEVTILNLIVDRESLWAELDNGPELAKPPDTLVASRSESEETEEEDDKAEEEEEEVESEHTESADTSGAQVSTENSSSGSTPYACIEAGGIVNGLRRAESEHTQASDSLTSEDEEDLELEAMARSRLLKQEREKREAIDSLFRHVLLYPVAGGWRHLLQGLGLLDSLLRHSAECPLVEALSSTSLDTSSAAHLNLVSNLLQRHQQAQDGNSFYGSLLSPSSSPSVPPSLLIELLVSLCLRFLRSHYPSYLSLSPVDLQGNRDVQVKSVEVLTRIMNQLGCMARGQEGSDIRLEPINRFLSGCKVQQYALLTLSASMYISQRGTDKGPPKSVELLDEQGSLSEESLVNLGPGGGQEQYPLQRELLKLLQALIALEYHVCPGGAASSTGSAAQYVQSQPITTQGMFVSAAARALQPQYGYAMHPHWVSLLCSSLPYLGRSLGIIVAPLISQICRNLDELVKLYDLSGRRENIAPDYPLTLLEGLTTIAHYCLLDNKRSSVACDPVDIRNARNAVIDALPHILSTMALLWGVVLREEHQKRGYDSGQSGRHTSTSILRQRILEFLVPLTCHYGVQLMASLGVVWSSRKSKRRHKNKVRTSVLPVASDSRLTIVDLVKSLNTLHTETILQLIKEVVKKPHQIKGEQVCIIKNTYACITHVLQENIAPLLSLLRESVQLNLAPPGHFLLLGILNDFVNRLSNLDNKKDTRDLQEVTQRILEAVGGIAGSSLEQTSWLSRSLEVKVQPQVCPEANEADDVESMPQTSTMVSSSAPSVYSVQALVLLAEVLAPLLDMVYRSDEKEKAVPLISRLMYYVFPYLKNHSAYNMPSFEAGSQLLSSLSGYAYTKRAWKKEVFDLFMDPLFFTMDASCASSWKSIIDHLLTHEKTMFKDLMSKCCMQSGSLKLFANVDQKPMLLKRQAFAMFSGEPDQYHLYLPLIQERLTEALRMNPSPAVSAQMFLMFRVLLLRISSQHLTSLWPIMVTELIRIFARLEKALQADKDVSKLTKVVRGALERNGPVNFSQADLDMYLSACKFLDTCLAFPPERMPVFQMYRWAFVPEVDVNRYNGPETALIEDEQECTPHVVRVLETLNGLNEEFSTDLLEFPLLTQHSLSSITQLLPFLRTLCCSFHGPPPQFPAADYPAASSDSVLRRLEHITEKEFLDSMES
uniref:DOP1 leucine zipper like protein B n=1 Tax=Mastacembelus armatus TaxID=205130 RepID=A0A7N8Y880_9TELE